MRLNILVEDSKVEQVRIEYGDDKILTLPCSETGKEPATHWFCNIAGDEKKIMSIYAKKKLSTMELNTGPKEFLEKWNLKIIK